MRTRCLYTSLLTPRRRSAPLVIPLKAPRPVPWCPHKVRPLALCCPHRFEWGGVLDYFGEGGGRGGGLGGFFLLKHAARQRATLGQALSPRMLNHPRFVSSLRRWTSSHYVWDEWDCHSASAWLPGTSHICTAVLPLMGRVSKALRNSA